MCIINAFDKCSPAGMWFLEDLARMSEDLDFVFNVLVSTIGDFNFQPAKSTQDEFR